jgi:hypothetical protein
MLKKVNQKKEKETVLFKDIESKATTKDDIRLRKYQFFSLLVLGIVLLAIILIFSIVFVVMWWSTKPNLETITSVIDPNAVELYKTLLKDHIEEFKNLVTLFLTPFFPVLTLVIGFIVGREVRK